MNFSIGNYRRKRRALLATIAIASVFVVTGGIHFVGRIWADRTGMTQLEFSNALFCQRVSQAINDSLGDGIADGSDCANFNLYVSSSEIGNIQSLNIVPPEDGFGDIDFESQSISIAGDWVTAFYNLTSLSITNMYVANIAPLQWASGDLQYLNLSGNRISDVAPLYALRNRVTYLDLSGNPINSGLTELSKFTSLTTLKMANTGVTSFVELFRPPDIEIEYNEYTGEPRTIRDANTNEQLHEIPRSSKLAKVLRTFDISDNEDISHEIEEKDRVYACNGNLQTFENYPINKNDTIYPLLAESTDDLAITELVASRDSLNADDLICVTRLKNLQKLDVSENHIDDFASISGKTYTELKAASQVYSRSTDELDYGPLPTIFSQVQQSNFIPGVPDGSNIAVPRSSLVLDNAQFNGDLVRFVNAAIASASDEAPQPAIVEIPAETGVFENSRLQVYFTGQVVTFNDSNLCNEVYRQGEDYSAFVSIDGNIYVDTNERIVLTNACNAAKKQIAMKAGASYIFLRLILDGINGGAPVDLTGLEEFTGLEVLKLSNNGLTDIDELSNTNSLQQLWLNDNNLGNDTWPTITNSLTNLTILYLNNNHMSEIPMAISNLYNLGNLYLVNNGISNIDPLAYASRLTVLDLSENSRITDFSGLAQQDSVCRPSILKIENAGITRLPNISTLEAISPNLLNLNLNGNQITDETIDNLAVASKLEELYLSNNRISSTSGFSNIAKLKKLFLDNNQITEVSGLISLDKLTELHLSNNKITSITGLNTLPALATLDLKNQNLSDTLTDGSTYALPEVFLQAMELEFPRVSGFQSTENYTVENGSVDYLGMTATMTDTHEPMIVTILDGGLAGTKVKVEHTGTGGGGSWEFINTLTDNTGGEATIAATSANTFTVTSDVACMALLTQDSRTTWSRLNSNPLANNKREFNTNQIAGAEIVIAYAGDVNADTNINTRDARKITNIILGKESATSLQEELADVDGSGGVNIRDVRALIKNILGTGEINW